MVHEISNAVPNRAAARAVRRRRRIRRRKRAAAAFCVLALAAGLVWGKGWWRTSAETASVQTVMPEQRAEALRLLDQAVTARYAGEAYAAVRLAGEARQADSSVPGLDMLLAEMALEQGDTRSADAAAQQAIQQSPYAADARIVLALNCWMLREQMGTEAAGTAATQRLAEAAAEELSDGAVRFFAGDVQRATGRPGEAHRSALEGLHRQQVWHSSALLSAHLAIALDEADPYAVALLDLDDESEVFGRTAAAFGRARREGNDTDPAMAAVRAIFTQKHLDLLSRSPALTVAALGEGKKLFVLPFGEIPPPVSAAKSNILMPWDQAFKTLPDNDLKLPREPMGNQ